MNDTHSLTRISVYPVGVFATAKYVAGHIKRGNRQQAWRVLHGKWKYLQRQAKAGNWHAIGNAFNGYLAEIDYPPAELQHWRCGHGWTRKRAARDLGHHLWIANRGAS